MILLKITFLQASSPGSGPPTGHYTGTMNIKKTSGVCQGTEFASRIGSRHGGQTTDGCYTQQRRDRTHRLSKRHERMKRSRPGTSLVDVMKWKGTYYRRRECPMKEFYSTHLTDSCHSKMSSLYFIFIQPFLYQASRFSISNPSENMYSTIPNITSTKQIVGSSCPPSLRHWHL